jgi:hypothetical protein
MTIADIDPTQEIYSVSRDVVSPYFLECDSPEVKVLLDTVIATAIPYADGLSNPDLGSKSIYIFEGNQEGSNLGRVVEASVLKNDPKWGMAPEELKHSLSPLEDNSRFFVLVDNTEDGPVLVGSLRIADCQKGPSETIGFYEETHEQAPVPAELTAEEGSKIWDIVYVAVRPEFQDGVNSAWLYFAMHKNSGESSVDKWISNITNDERKRLAFIGIPFQEVVGVKPVIIPSQIDPHESQAISFYHTETSVVADAVDSVARKNEGRTGSAASFIAKIALVARYGTFTRPDDSTHDETFPIAS